jgi:protease-4
MRKLIIVVSVLLVAVVSLLLSVFWQKELVNKVAVVRLEGIITSEEPYLSVLSELENDRTVKAVVLRVNSPGGVVGACQEIYEKLKRISKKKPVVVSMGSLCASGCLYLSLGANKIVAQPGTITGSIGVIVQSYNLQKLAEKLGIKVVSVKSGKFKDILSPFKEMKPEERKIIESVVKDAYSQFVEAVSKSRKIPVEKVYSFADGRIFTGRTAKKLGIVDELGGLDRAIEIAKSLAKTKELKVEFVKVKKPFIKKIFSSIENLRLKETKIMYLFGG